MAASDQIKSLIKSFGEGDDARFFASALQIAASEARQGHSTFAHDLKKLIENARKSRSSLLLDQGKIVNMSPSRRELNELIEVFDPRIDLSNMVLDKYIEDRLHRLIREQNQWELLRQHNLSPIRKLLLTGPPGTGKTMTAHAIAGELGIPLFVIRLDGLLSKYMGESISKLRVIFDLMPSQRAVYLFDEFDSIGTHRQQTQDIGEIKRVLNSFLINIEKDNSDSIIIAATNLPEALDVALFRRFDDIIAYPLPSKDEIYKAITKSTAGYTFDTRIDFSLIVEGVEGINYSDISQVSEATIKEKILSNSLTLSRDYFIKALHHKKPYATKFTPPND